MNDKISNKILWWLGCLLAILMLLLEFPLQWLNDFDYNKLLQIVPYKWQLLIWLLTILLIILAFTYRKAFPKSIEDTSSSIGNITTPPEKLTSREIHFRLNGLTKPEKELMRRFYQEDSRSLRISTRNSTADGLRSLGILEITSLVETPKGISYTVNPIYWDYMKKRPDVIDIRE